MYQVFFILYVNHYEKKVYSYIVILTVSNIYAKTNIKYYYSSDFRKKGK